MDTRHIPLTGIRGMSEVPEIWHIPQHEARGTSEVPQQHTSLLRELLMPPPIIGQGNMDVTNVMNATFMVCIFD